MIYKQCVTLYNPKMYPHTKFGIPIANNIGDVPEVKFSDPNQYGTLWHPNMYPQSKFGIPTLKQYNINALDTIFLELGSEDKLKITVTPETVCDTHSATQGVSTHCLKLYNRYAPDTIQVQTDRLPAVCPACMELITTCGCKNVQNRQM